MLDAMESQRTSLNLREALFHFHSAKQTAKRMRRYAQNMKAVDFFQYDFTAAVMTKELTMVAIHVVIYGNIS